MRRSMKVALALTSGCLLAYFATGISEGVEQEYYEAWAPIWLPEEGMQAMLLLNNNRGEEVAFELETSDSQGALLQADSFLAEPNASLSLPLAEQLQGVRSGSVAVRYRRELGAELPAQLLVQGVGVSANYLLSERRFHSTPEGRAAFWLPTPQTRLYALLLNKSGRTVEAELEVKTGKGRRVQDSFILTSGMLLPLELRGRYRLSGGEGSGLIHVSHSGKPGDVVSAGFALDSRRGFAASLNWSDAGFASLSGTVILNHIKYGSHEEGFLAPHATLANAGNSDLTVSPLLRLDGLEGLELLPRHLAPGEVQTFSLEPELRRHLGSAPLETALELRADDPGSLVAAGVSVDRTLEHSYTSKAAVEAELRQSYSYPFRSDEDWNTKIVVANRSAEPAGYSVFFFFEGQHYTYPTHHFLQPFEQRVIDVGQIRREQLADDFGRTLPAQGALRGQIKLLVHEGYLGRVIAQGVMHSLRQGISLALSCDTCPSQPDRLVLLDSINGVLGQQARFNSHAGGPKRQIYPKLQLSDGSSWFETGGVVDYDPTNDAVARVDEGLSGDFVEFLSAGQTEIRASLDSCFWRTNFHDCEPEVGEFESCGCECLPIVLTVPPSQGFLPSPPALVTVTNPTVTIQDTLGVPKNAAKDIQVTIPQGPLNVDVDLRLSTTAGSGSARFLANNSTTLKVRQSGPVKVRGITESSTADNIQLQAKLGSSVLDSDEFSVVWVTLDLRQSGTISSDNSAISFFQSTFNTTSLGPRPLQTSAGDTFWSITIEIVGTVKPGNFTGTPMELERKLVLSKVFLDRTLASSAGPRDDSSIDALRDRDPQSGSSSGKIYDLDAPGFFISGSTVGTIRRRRDNYTQWAMYDGQRASDDFNWFFVMSLIETAAGEQFHNDVSGDNSVGKGTTKLTWDLK